MPKRSVPNGDYLELVDTETGEVVKRTKLATEKQLSYLNSLRAKLGKSQLKNRPPIYVASKAIDKSLKKLAQLELSVQNS